jgi:hypothetical protein
VLVAVRQHRQETGALDSGIQLALKNSAGSGQAGGDDFSVFRDEVTQGVDVFVVDLFHTGNREAAKPLALEKQRLGVALGALVFVELLESSHINSSTNLEQIPEPEKPATSIAARLPKNR